MKFLIGVLSVFITLGNARSECPDLSGTYSCFGGIVLEQNNTGDATVFSLKKDNENQHFRQLRQPNWSIFYDLLQNNAPFNYVVDGNKHKHESSGAPYIGFCEEDKLKIAFLPDDSQDDRFPRVVEFWTDTLDSFHASAVIYKTLYVRERINVSTHGGDIEQVLKDPTTGIVIKAEAPAAATYNSTCDGHLMEEEITN